MKDLAQKLKYTAIGLGSALRAIAKTIRQTAKIKPNFKDYKSFQKRFS